MDFEGRSRISLRLNMAPLLDVMFLLLIFFMLTSTFLAADVIDLELPESSSTRVVNDLDIVVLVGDDGSVAVNGEMMVVDQLESYLGSLLIDPSRQLITLKTDAEESVQDMLTIMDIIRTAGGERIFLATDPKEKE